MIFKQLDEIARKYGTPHYLMYDNRYLENIKSFQKAFKSRYSNFILGYSFKTNYVPSLCKIAMNAGCYAEVVSEMEYTLAKRIGFKHIIFNGPIKKDAILLSALEDNAVINLDSQYELRTILKFKAENPERKISIGLRLNIDLTDEDGISKVQYGLRVGRFGFTYETFADAVHILKQNNINIVSMHGHTSSSDRAVENYRLITKQMLQVGEKLSLNELKYFDIGGGFFGAAAEGFDISNKPTYKDYANCILDECLRNEWFCKIKPNIVIEPGVSVVANVFSYVSKIFQKKQIFRFDYQNIMENTFWLRL